VPDIDDVLGLMMTDASFKADLVRDPKGVLDGYDLSPDDLSTVAQQLSEDQEALDPVEQRTSRAGLFALFSTAMRTHGATPPDGIDLSGLEATTAENPPPSGSNA